MDECFGTVTILIPSKNRSKPLQPHQVSSIDDAPRDSIDLLLPLSASPRSATPSKPWRVGIRSVAPVDLR